MELARLNDVQKHCRMLEPWESPDPLWEVTSAGGKGVGEPAFTTTRESAPRKRGGLASVARDVANGLAGLGFFAITERDEIAAALKRG